MSLQTSSIRTGLCAFKQVQFAQAYELSNKFNSHMPMSFQTSLTTQRNKQFSGCGFIFRVFKSVTTV
jgi:hypothetical protein